MYNEHSLEEPKNQATREKTLLEKSVRIYVFFCHFFSMEKSSLYKIEVAPILILPLKKSPFFSYASDTPIPLGSLLTISFGKQSLQGVVFACEKLPGKKPSWMKTYSNILIPAFLTQHQLALAEYISTEYFTSLGKVLKHFIPKKTSLSLDVSSQEKLYALPKLSTKDAHLLKCFCDADSSFPAYLDMFSLQNFEYWLAHLMKRMTIKKGQILIIVPEIILISLLQKIAKTYFPQQKIVSLHSKLTDSTYYTAWERIRSGESTLIFSTRQGMFAPFQNIQCIVLFEEQDDSYKQWNMSPRYDTKKVIKKLALLHKSKVLFISGIPGIESRFLIQEKKCFAIQKERVMTPLLHTLHIVNLRLERFQKNYSPLSKELITALTFAYKHKKQALLYIHRQGMNAFSICEHCKNIFRCPISSHTLSLQNDGSFKCTGCSYRTDIFPSCPHCHNLTFRHIGFGTERIEKEIRKLFPSAHIFRADAKTLRTIKDIEKFHSDSSKGKIDILIGTQSILKSHHLPKLALIGMIDADSLLSFSDFRSDEKLFQILTRFVEANVKQTPLPEIYVQTFHPESTFFQRIQMFDSKAFLGKILEERKDLFYPPYSRIFLIRCFEKTEKGVQKKGKKIYEDIGMLFSSEKEKNRISISNKINYSNIEKLFEISIIIRIDSNNALPHTIYSYLQKLDMTYSIDVDPLSLS